MTEYNADNIDELDDLNRLIDQDDSIPDECKPYRKLIATFGITELNEIQCSDLQDHIANCESCLHEHNANLKLKMAINKCCYEQVPENFRQAVLASLQD